MKKGSLDRRRLEASPLRARTGVLPASRLKNWPATGSSSGFWQPRKPGVCGRALGIDGEGVGTEIRAPRAELDAGCLLSLFFWGLPQIWRSFEDEWNRGSRAEGGEREASGESGRRSRRAGAD